MCIGCDERLTREHILLACSDFTEIRKIHFAAQSLRIFVVVVVVVVAVVVLKTFY